MHSPKTLISVSGRTDAVRPDPEARRARGPRRGYAPSSCRGPLFHARNPSRIVFEAREYREAAELRGFRAIQGPRGRARHACAGRGPGQLRLRGRGREPIAERLRDKVERLHHCASWLVQLDLGEYQPVTNLRPQGVHRPRRRPLRQTSAATDRRRLDELVRARSPKFPRPESERRSHRGRLLLRSTHKATLRSSWANGP